MRKSLACLIVLLLCSPIPVVTGNGAYTAERLRYACSAKDKPDSSIACMIFFRGVLDGMIIGRENALSLAGVQKKEIQRGKYSTYCVPQDAQLDQLGEMFVKYMNEHPENLHEPASFQFAYMLSKYFPCKSK